MDEIADVINYDPAIMSQVLKISNSAFYNFPHKITTVSKAVQVIGTNSVYDLVLAYGVANAFRDVNAEVIDLDRFWEQGVSCALLAKYFAEELSIKESEKLFVCGLLHNIGELVVVSLKPELAQKCALITSKSRPLDMQQKYLGCSYADIGSRLLSLWGIPIDITMPIRRQHVFQSEAETQEEKIIQLSSVMSLNNIYKEHYRIRSNISEGMYQNLGFDQQCLDHAQDFTNLQLMSTLALFNPSSFSLY